MRTNVVVDETPDPTNPSPVPVDPIPGEPGGPLPTPIGPTPGDPLPA